MLLCCGHGFACSRWLEGMEDFAGDVALEAAHHLVLRFALGDAPRHVVAGGLVTAQPYDQDDVQGPVASRLLPRLSRCRIVLPLETSSGLTPQSLAKAASLRIRPGLSRRAVSSVAAVSGPTP
jgi:hypothetical protein